jgi:hypothetical protein
MENGSSLSGMDMRSRVQPMVKTGVISEKRALLISAGGREGGLSRQILGLPRRRASQASEQNRCPVSLKPEFYKVFVAFACSF